MSHQHLKWSDITVGQENYLILISSTARDTQWYIQIWSAVFHVEITFYSTDIHINLYSFFKNVHFNFACMGTCDIIFFFGCLLGFKGLLGDKNCVTLFFSQLMVTISKGSIEKHYKRLLIANTLY